MNLSAVLLFFCMFAELQEVFPCFCLFVRITALFCEFSLVIQNPYIRQEDRYLSFLFAFSSLLDTSPVPGVLQFNRSNKYLYRHPKPPKTHPKISNMPHLHSTVMLLKWQKILSFQNKVHVQVHNTQTTGSSVFTHNASLYSMVNIQVTTCRLGVLEILGCVSEGCRWR